MPNETVPTVAAAFTAAKRRADLRRAYGEAAAEAALAERDLTVARAFAEQAVIDHVADGDEKKLGANEDARKRAFTRHLEQSAAYVDARTSLAEAAADRLLFEIDLQLAEDRLTILVTALAAGITDLPAGLLDDHDESSAIVFAYPTADAPAALAAAAIPGGPA